MSVYRDLYRAAGRTLPHFVPYILLLSHML